MNKPFPFWTYGNLAEKKDCFQTTTGRPKGSVNKKGGARQQNKKTPPSLRNYLWN
jgi:hypothetical protein